MTNTKSRTSGAKRDVNAAKRAALAVRLRAQKKTYDDIALECGYASRGACYDAIQRELKRVVVENVEELRREELASLEQLEQECWKRMEDEEYTKSMLFAVDRILSIKERRAKLMGLEAKPEEQTMQQNYTKRIILTHELPTGGNNANTPS